MLGLRVYQRHGHVRIESASKARSCASSGDTDSCVRTEDSSRNVYHKHLTLYECVTRVHVRCPWQTLLAVREVSVPSSSAELINTG